jgi:hypothetical protein
MRGIIMQSVLLAFIAIPILSARDQSIVRGLKKALLLYACFGVMYTLALRFIYPHLS